MKTSTVNFDPSLHTFSVFGIQEFSSKTSLQYNWVFMIPYSIDLILMKPNSFATK